MSLTSHIRQGKKSPIGHFFSKHFAQTHSITKDANLQLQVASTLHLADHTPASTYMLLGTALDYRIRFYFPIDPSEELIARRGGDQLPDWVLNDTASEVDIDHVWELVQSFFDSLDANLARMQPTGRRLDAKEEQLLARYCYVLALFEPFGRGEWTPDTTLTEAALKLAEKENAEELLAIPQIELVEDLCELSWVFHDKCAHLLSQPAVLNPTFQGSGDVGGADADLIVDGCLIEIKASIRAAIRPEWLRQLAGYLLLDYDEPQQIKSLGIYMARQGLLLTWPVEEYLQKLTGDPSATIATLRREFRYQFGTNLAQHEKRETPREIPSGHAATNIFAIERFED